MPPPARRSNDSARHALLRQRQMARNWGLFALAIALIICAVIAPHTALLVFVALVVFGAFGIVVGWGLRLINRLFNPPLH